ncbi:MAG: hypothetical protein ACKN9V_03870, partial [Pseudomonadota bacterium]
SLAGCLLGSVLSSCWGVIQPLAVLWIVYGSAFGETQLERMLTYFNHLLSGFFHLTPNTLGWVILLFLACKAVLAFLLTLAGWRASFDEQHLLDQRFLKWGLKGLPRPSKMDSTLHPAFGALKELKQPLFLFSFFCTAVFFYFAEDSKAGFIWNSLRPIAIAYLFFLAIRLFPVDSWIKKRGLGGTALASALEFIEGKSKNEKSHE